jgi:hypothetical protein
MVDWVRQLQSRDASRRDDLDGAWVVGDRTPAHTFTHVFLEHEGRVFLVTVRDRLDPLAVKEFGGALWERASEISEGKPLQILEHLSWGHEFFDSAGIFRQDAHGMFPELAEAGVKLWVAFPMARCEFSGDEDLAEIAAIRRDFVCTIDWYRNIAPKIRLAFENTKTKARTRGKGRGLAAVSTLTREMRLLVGAPGSWLEVENYRHLVCRLSAGHGDQLDLVAGGEKGCQAVSVDEASKRIGVFIVKGDVRALEPLPC